MDENIFEVSNPDGTSITISDEELKRFNHGLGNKSPQILRQIVEKIERLEEEQQAIKDDIKDIFTEAKGQGFAPKIIRKVISIRKKNREELSEEMTLTDIYLEALGDMPLFSEPQK